MRKTRILALALALTLLLPALGGLAESDQDWLEYSIYLGLSDVATFLDNPNDVVTPYVENKFHIRVSEVIQGGLSTIPFKERLATFIAANNMPDVIVGGAEGVAYATNTGRYGDGFEDLIRNKMPNMNKMLDQGYWPEYSNNGKVTQIPNVIVNVTEEPYASDPYIAPPTPWTMWVREDILKQCGYEFETNKDIFARTTQKNLKPSVEDFKITPEIKTPEDFRALLEKIKALNIKVGDSDLIPFSSIDWSQFHMGCMFDFGHWRINDAGEVDGFLGSPGAKEYYKFLNGLYRDGLIDPDFIVQTSDQLQAKITSGRVAAGMFAANYPDAQAGLLKTVGEDAAIRYIPWPKADESGLGAFDVFTPGFWRTVIRSDFEQKERLIEYFDWFYSDEGIEILSWGPEEAGLWEVNESGVRQFKDPQVQHDMINQVMNAKGPDYYGLYAPNSNYFLYLSKAGACAPYGTLNYFSVQRTAPPILDESTIGRIVGTGGFDYTGRYSYGDGTDLVGGINSWYWSKFTTELCAPILSAATDEEFEEAWADMYDDFVYDTDYEAAKAQMTEFFKSK